jgi:hypothetical protein
MSQPFVVPPQNIQACLSMLYEYCYSLEMMNELNWDVEQAEDSIAFDHSIMINLLGGNLPTKKDFNDVN